jgi:hypothetical protein
VVARRPVAGNRGGLRTIHSSENMEDIADSLTEKTNDSEKDISDNTTGDTR